MAYVFYPVVICGLIFFGLHTPTLWLKCVLIGAGAILFVYIGTVLVLTYALSNESIDKIISDDRDVKVVPDGLARFESISAIKDFQPTSEYVENREVSTNAGTVLPLADGDSLALENEKVSFFNKKTAKSRTVNIRFFGAQSSSAVHAVSLDHGIYLLYLHDEPLKFKNKNGAEQSTYRKSHLYLVSDVHPTGLELLSFSLKKGLITGLRRDGNQLIIQSTDDRDQANPVQYYWRADLSKWAVEGEKRVIEISTPLRISFLAPKTYFENKTEFQISQTSDSSKISFSYNPIGVTPPVGSTETTITHLPSVRSLTDIYERHKSDGEQPFVEDDWHHQTKIEISAGTVVILNFKGIPQGTTYTYVLSKNGQYGALLFSPTTNLEFDWTNLNVKWL